MKDDLVYAAKVIGSVFLGFAFWVVCTARAVEWGIGRWVTKSCAQPV